MIERTVLRRLFPRALNLVWPVALILVLAACTAAPAAPTQAPAKPAEPTKAAAPAAAQPAAAPTKAPAAQPTAASAPAKKVDFPAGRPISLIIPWPAAGGTDVAIRLVIPGMEKELGVQVQPLNRAGAGSQVGVTEMANAKPDGYTIGATSLPTTTTLYLDDTRKTAFTRKSFVPLGASALDPNFLAVPANSPYKTLKDLIDACKAKPEGISFGSPSLLGGEHLAIVDLAKQAGIKVKIVQFDGSTPAVTALLGGHIDVYDGTMSNYASALKAGQIRLLGVMDREQSPLAPEVQTLEAQGYKVYAGVARVMSAPAGTPKEIVDILSQALKKSVEQEDYKKKAMELYVTPRYMTPEQASAYWEDEESRYRPLIDEARKSAQ